MTVKRDGSALGGAASGEATAAEVTMPHRCSVCAAPIQRQAKGYKRKSLLSVIDRKSAHKLFPGLNPREAFLCFGCVRNVYQKTKKCGKRRIYVDPNPPPRPAPAARPVPSVPAEPPPPKKLKKRLKTTLNEHDYASQEPAPSPRPDPPPARRVHRGPMAQVCAYLRRKNFTSALNRLLQVSGFTEALIKVCRKIISNEVKHVYSLQTNFSQKESESSTGASGGVTPGCCTCPEILQEGEVTVTPGRLNKH